MQLNNVDDRRAAQLAIRNAVLTPRAAFARYCRSAAAVCLALFGFVWIYVVLAPMAFLEAPYPIWLAKRAMISKCNLGDLVVLGDSRAEAGIVPARLSAATYNFALDATSPIETYFILARMKPCIGRLPRAVILSIAMPSFTQVSVYLWENAIRSGVLNSADLTAIERAAAKLGDNSVRDRPAGFGLSGWTRDLAYISHFPPLYSSSMIRGDIFFRYSANLRLFADVTASRGYMPHEIVQTGAGDRIGPEAEMSNFEPSPIQDYYFDRTLALLSELGLPVYYVLLPLSEQTLTRTRPEIVNSRAIVTP